MSNAPSPDVIAERQAVLLGYDAIAKLRAEKEQTARMWTVWRERDRRLVAAIRKANR